MRRSLPAVRRVLFLLLLVACGSRTGLLIDGEEFSGLPPTLDGGEGLDGSTGRDATADGSLPGIDARPPVDVDRRDCPDADALLVYTITATKQLQSFNPSTGQFRLIGNIACPAGKSTEKPAEDATPFSMAVDRKGIAYILFTDERLYRVSTLTGACVATSFVPRQSNFRLFGMGFATNTGGPDETLFVAGDDRDTYADKQRGARGLARVSPDTFALAPVGDFSPVIAQAELTGRGDGRLYAFYDKGIADPGIAEPSYIGEINGQTGQVVGERRFDAVDQGEGWAFAFWGGDFYMFHAPGGSTRVTRWRPTDDSVTEIARTQLKIVGAGVSTCAPQQ
jgi:hypothetical protein